MPNSKQNVVPTDSRIVDAAVVSLQECLADSDPAAFSRESIDSLRELSELLRESASVPSAAPAGP